MKLVRVGIIGTSWWADAMYLPSLAGTEKATVVACCGRNEERARELASIWNIPKVYTDWGKMLDEEPLDAVLISTPNDTHCPITLAALEKGLHVLCEKPLALNYAEARKMAEAAKAHQAVTMVPFTYSFLPMTQSIKRLLNEGYLGKPYHLNFRYNADYGRSPEYSWRFDQKRAGSGSLGDLGSHFIYLSVWFFGSVTHVSAELSTVIERPDLDPTGQPYLQTDDFSIIILTFSNGAKGVVQATTVAHEPTPWGQSHYFDLHGSGGTLRGWTDWERTYKLYGAKSEEKQFQEIEIPEMMWDGRQRRDIQQMYKETFRKRGKMTGEFIEAVASGKACSPTFQDGAEIQRILEAALLSAQENRKVEIKEIS